MGKDHGQGRSDAGLTGQRANVQYSTVQYSNGQWAAWLFLPTAWPRNATTTQQQQQQQQQQQRALAIPNRNGC